MFGLDHLGLGKEGRPIKLPVGVKGQVIVKGFASLASAIAESHAANLGGGTIGGRRL